LRAIWLAKAGPGWVLAVAALALPGQFPPKQSAPSQTEPILVPGGLSIEAMGEIYTHAIDRLASLLKVIPTVEACGFPGEGLTAQYRGMCVSVDGRTQYPLPPYPREVPSPTDEAETMWVPVSQVFDGAQITRAWTQEASDRKPCAASPCTTVVFAQQTLGPAIPLLADCQSDAGKPIDPRFCRPLAVLDSEGTPCGPQKSRKTVK
jgi:hypothetical protein